MRCIGYRFVEFTPSGSSEKIKGYSCTFIEPYETDGYGFKSDRQFLSEDKFQAFDIKNKTLKETEFTVFYNRYGKISKIE